MNTPITRLIQRLFTVLLKILLIPLTVIFIYLWAALGAALMPAPKAKHHNDNAHAPYTVYLVSNGIHVNIVLPTISPAMDWRTTLGENFALDYPYFYLGWGSRTFYRDVPTWGDFTLGIAVRAIAFDDSVISIMPGYAPLPDQALTRKIQLNEAQLRQLSTDILSQFQSFRSITATGHYPLLYPAHGHYHPFLTCNEWIRQRLSPLGVPMPLWSPFDRPLLHY